METPHLSTNCPHLNFMVATPIPIVEEVGAGTTPLEERLITGHRIIRPLKNQRQFDRPVVAPVTGDSLKDDNILDGDYAVLKLNFELEEVTDGRLVVVKCPAGVIMKHFHLTEDGRVRLRSANIDYPDLYFDLEDVEIQAVVMRTDRSIEWN